MILYAMPLLLMLSVTYCCCYCYLLYSTISVPIAMFKASLIFLFCSLEHMFLLTAQTQ